jgi:NAD(P)H dehydrogenase (quinone)
MKEHIMKIGIIVHSKTGNSILVGQKLKDKLISDGHVVVLERVAAVDEEEMDPVKIKLKDLPSTEGYDILIFGAPVHGFSLSPVMRAYISQLKTLEGIKVGGFVTQFFPFKQLGGSHSIQQLIKLCESKGGKVFETGVINWSNKKREGQIDNLVDNMRNHMIQ